MKTYSFNGIATILIIIGCLLKEFVPLFTLSYFQIVVIALMAQGNAMLSFLLHKLSE